MLRSRLVAAILVLSCGCSDASPDQGQVGDPANPEDAHVAAEDAGAEAATPSDSAIEAEKATGDAAVEAYPNDAAADVKEAAVKDCDAATTPEGRHVCTQALAVESLGTEGTASDIASLGDYVKGRPVVLIGESDHGVAEIIAAELKLIKYLYYERGYVTLAVELGRGASLYLQEYLDTGVEAPLMTVFSASKGTYFDVVEIKEYYQELRKLVLGRPSGVPPLKLTGFDIEHQRKAARDQVLAYLTGAASQDLIGELKPLVQCISITQECEDSQLLALNKLNDASAQLVAASSQSAYHQVYDIVQGTADTIHFYLLYYQNTSAAILEASEYREGVMVRRAFEYIDANPSGIIFQGHTTHLAKKRDATTPYSCTGEHIVQHSGADHVYNIVLLGNNGTHLVRSDEGLEVKTIDPAPDYYLEWILKDAKLPMLFLDIALASNHQPESAFLSESIPALWTWYGWYGVDLAYVPSEYWDGVLYVDTISATTPN